MLSPRIETERLILRRYKESDIDAIYEIITDERLSKYNKKAADGPPQRPTSDGFRRDLYIKSAARHAAKTGIPRDLATTEKHPQSFSSMSCTYCNSQGLLCQDLFTFTSKGF